MSDHYTAKKTGIYIPIGGKDVLFASAATDNDAKVLAHLLNVYKGQVEEERRLRDIATDLIK